ncbi:hypothetical protein C1645_713539 [Glomus cerebriforme]|uniref:Uncharacterized protein n=1 Tax=Glomus cerebriforme TaxID=658196 RepID=A0A397STU4_9GLOM|nr:hypothetical protein C1645_713539 [Glomus cerebriforme]
MTAKLHLANCYRLGKGIDKDEKKAFDLIKNLAEKEYVDAQFQLGYYHYKGIGTEVDKSKAYEVYKITADKEYINAQFQLGYYYDNGIGTEVNKSKAYELYKVAAEKGHDDAQYNLGKCYELGKGIDKDEKKAFELIKNLAEQEYLNAQFQLGYYYDEGIGTEVNKSKAYELYKVAAEKGHDDAQYNLSKCYELGKGTDKDEKEAFELIKYLAEQEYLNAQFQLGYYYDKGIGTEVNKSKVFELYKIAAEKGHIIAQYNLSLLYQLGEGIDKDEKKAFDLMKNLAEKEYLNAQFRLGYYYDKGIGTKVNKSKAYELYKVAAEKGHDDAQYNLGLCYENGIGIKKNEAKALYWYQKSSENDIGEDKSKVFKKFEKLAKHGYVSAQNKLGYFYENGINIEKDLEKSIYWYKKSAEHGNKIAYYNLDIVNTQNNQVIHQLKLNHGLFLDWCDIRPSTKAILKDDGELNISIYDGQPTVYITTNDPITSDFFFNSHEDNDVSINFPIAEITYEGNLLESFSKYMDDENLHKLYGQLFARKTLIGGKLIIKDFNSATQTQINALKFYLYCAYNSAKYSIEIPFNNLFTLNLLPKIVTLGGIELNSHIKLVKWMNNLYQEEEKNINIISYDNLIPVSQLRKSLVDDSVNKIQPNEKLSLDEWVGDAVNNNIASWTGDFHLFQGLLFNKNYEIEISKKIAINFIKIPKVNPSDKSYLKIIKPSTNLEVSLISNNIFSFNNLSTFPSIKVNNIKSYTDYIHVLIKCERYEILLNKDNIRPTKEFEQIIEEALNSMKPLKALQNVFDEFGHLFPQRIILGRSLKNIISNLSSFNIDNINLKSPIFDSLKPYLDNLNVSYLLTPKGRIIEKSDLPNWIQNINNLEIIEFDDVIPLYKFLEAEKQNKIDDMLKNNFKILMTGITDLKDLDNNDIEYYKRINIEPSLEDENYEVFGSVISRNHSKLEEIYVNFGSYDFNGFFALIKKLEETSIDIKECYVLWMIIEKPSELLVFSPSNREFQVDCIKESIILRPDKSNYYIKTSFSLSLGNTIFVHAYYSSTNYEPNNIIKLVKWSYNYINFQIIKSTYNTYNESSNNFLTNTENTIDLDLHICVLCSDYKNLKFDKIDNKKEGKHSLDLSGYILTKDNFNESLLAEINEVGDSNYDTV